MRPDVLLRVPDPSVQCERYGDRVAARKVRDWRVLHAASGDAEEYPSEKELTARAGEPPNDSHHRAAQFAATVHAGVSRPVVR